MAISDTANYMAAKTAMARENVRSAQRQMAGEINGVGNRWAGEASTAFVREYNEIDSNVNSLLAHMEQMNINLRKLANEIKRADTEHQQKAAADAAAKQT